MTWVNRGSQGWLHYKGERTMHFFIDGRGLCGKPDRADLSPYIYRAALVLDPQPFCPKCYQRWVEIVHRGRLRRRVNLADPSTRFCRRGHDLNAVGRYETVRTTGYTQTSCRECNRLRAAKWQREHRHTRRRKGGKR